MDAVVGILHVDCNAILQVSSLYCFAVYLSYMLVPSLQLPLYLNCSNGGTFMWSQDLFSKTRKLIIDGVFSITIFQFALYVKFGTMYTRELY